MSTDRLSLPAAIFININIMLGVGIFTNTVVLSKLAGFLGCFSYLLIAVLLLPLIISIARLITIYPESGFYGYGAGAIHPSVGFFAAWSYFTGKIASATFMLHVAMLFIQQLAPFLQIVPTLMLDIGGLLLFVALNMFGLKTGSKIQQWLLSMKMIPILFVIISGLFIINGSSISFSHGSLGNMLSTLPFVLYTAAGFEATCSLSCRIDNARRNGPIAIFISYGFVLCTAFLYQLFFYGSVGTILGAQENYKAAIPLFLNALLPNSAFWGQIIQGIIYGAITTSALGAAYGIIYSNYWNLYALANAGHTFFRERFMKFNKHQVPYYCLLLEGLLGLLYVVLLQGEQMPLVQTSVLAGSIAYTVSVISLLAAEMAKQRDQRKLLVPLLGVCTCLLFVGSCVRNFMISGIYPLYFFMTLLALGAAMFLLTRRKARFISC